MSFESFQAWGRFALALREGGRVRLCAPKLDSAVRVCALLRKGGHSECICAEQDDDEYKEQFTAS